MSELHENLTVPQLRTLAREKGLKGARCLTLSKEQLIYFLDTGAVPTIQQEQTPGAPANTEAIAALIAAALTRPQTATVTLPDDIAETIADTAARTETLESNLQQIRDQIKDSNPAARIIEIQAAGNLAIDTTGKHETFGRLCAMLSRPAIHVFMVGPAGTGKTTLAEQAAEALDLPFYCTSVCNQTTKSEIFGYMSATGVYITTAFRKAYETGGIFLFDEIDAGNANVLAAVNSALANGYCSFPDAMIKRHPNFKCVAAGNTYGAGATRAYIGRNPLDAATKNRFCFIDIDYSRTIEENIARAYKTAGALEKIRQIRQTASRNGAPIIASTRNLIQIGELIAAGFEEREAFTATVFAGEKELADKYFPNY